MDGTGVRGEDSIVASVRGHGRKDGGDSDAVGKEEKAPGEEENQKEGAREGEEEGANC